MKVIAVNLKSDMLVKETSIFLKEINKLNLSNVIIFPSNIYIPYFLKQSYKVGIQNICYNLCSYTGEITAFQASNIGIDYLIVGDFDRREVYNETEHSINEKIKCALNENMQIILCVNSESKDEQKDIKNQILYDLRGITDLSNIMIAYEPAWMIGKNKKIKNKDIEEMNIFIKDTVSKYFDTDIKVLYGGEVNETNIKELEKISNLDGYLLSKNVDAVSFKKIIEVLNK
jgi:triosephosphate isomerase